MLYQFAINWDDISDYSANTSTTEITITKDINLYGGPYRCRVVGFTWADNLANGVAASNFTRINLKSSKFLFPALSQQNITFINRTEHTQPWLDGDVEFDIAAIAGDIDITMTVTQYNDARTVNAAGTWNTTGFITMILSLDIQQVAPDYRAAF